jgi:hypothetical protein
MRMPMKDLPVKTSVFTEKAPIKIWGTAMGGMLIAVHHFYPGTDVTPLLALFPDSLCPVPHWGYCLKGEMIIRYKDKEEILKGGDVFWWEPGHTFIVKKDAAGPCEVLEFSIAADFKKWEDVANKLGHKH